MGTSGTFGGPKSSLVPSWVDEPASRPVVHPNGAGNGAQSVVTDGDGDGGAAPTPTTPVPYPPMSTVRTGSGFRAARSNLTRGARTSDERSIRRAAGRYVSAIGGGSAAASRMRNSQAVTSGVARLARSFANQGPVEALRRLDLDGMAGAPAEDVFVAVTDVICPAGGTIDEAIARDAMLETVASFAAAGVGSFDGLSADDLREFFVGVLSRSIEGRILNEVGTNAVSVPSDIDGVEHVQNMLHDFIEGCVRDRFEASESDLSDLDTSAIDSFVGDLYAATLDLVKALGEDA